MKKIIKLSMAFAFVLTSLSSYASDENTSLRVRKGNKKEIKFSSSEINNAKIFIYDDENNLIYSELASVKDGISRIYKLDEFPEGTYFFVVEANLKKVKHEVIIINEEISTVTNIEI